MSDISETRRKSLGRKLKNLEVELEAAEKQRDIVLSGPDQVKLERQIDYLIEQIDEIKATLAAAELGNEGGTNPPHQEPEPPQPPNPPPAVDMQALIASLDRHKLLNLLLELSEDEFHRLLFEFKAIQPHHLGGDNIGRKTLELVLWAERHSQFPKLIELAYRLFPPPRLDWPVEG